MQTSKKYLLQSLRAQGDAAGGRQPSSQFRGVTARNGKWQPHCGIGVCKEKRQGGYLGLFTSEIEAAQAYDRAAVCATGLKAKTNFPLSNYTDLLSTPLLPLHASHA